MNQNKPNTIPNARKIITEALINFYKHRGARPQAEFFKPGLDSLKLTKEEMNDHQSNGLYAKYRALTGTIIKELIVAGTIEVKIPSQIDLVSDTDFLKKAPTVKKVDKSPLKILKERQELIVQTIAEKYLTSEEQKSGPKINKLKSYVGDKRQASKIENGTFKDVIEYVEKWFAKNEKIVILPPKNGSRNYPNTGIGKCLNRQYQIYLRYLNRNIKKEEYLKEFENSLISAIHILGGEFFEKLSLDVVKKVYGDRLVPNSDQLIGGTNDHGIDAKLEITDEFGVCDIVYIQSKIGEKGEKAIREFVGALTIENGHKGIFVTAGSVSTQNRKYFESRNRARKLSIIGREELLTLMIKYHVGIKMEKQDIIIDDDYFLSE